MKIVYVSEMVGRPGIYALKKNINTLKEEYKANFIFANANSLTYGFGIGKRHAIYLRKIGVDTILMGDKAFLKKDMVEFYPMTHYVLRPFNIDSIVGKGYGILNSIAVINLIGTSSFMFFPKNPFVFLEKNLEYIKQKSKMIIVNFHSVSTAEKEAMGHFCQSLNISCMIGSGGLCMTRDYKVLQNKTLYITDAGKSGSISGVGGFDSKQEIEKMIQGIPHKSFENWENLEMQGLLLEFDDESYAGKSITPIKIKTPVEENSWKEDL